jgi:uncharacterized phage protein gp47/JayE
MPEYGVLNTGFIPKRLDVILAEMQDSMKADLNINVAQNPKSYINVLLTDFSDKVAELWEVAQAIYLSMYPSSAEGASLDHAASFGGQLRDDDAPSLYPIDCTGKNGTVLPKGKISITSDTEPKVELINTQDGTITLDSCNRFTLKVSGGIQPGNLYQVSINGINYAYTAQQNDGDGNIFSALLEQIITTYTAYSEMQGELTVDSGSYSNALHVITTPTLTTKSVSNTILFQTVEYGDIVLNFHSINSIKSGTSGLDAVDNASAYTAGRKRITDEDLRLKYAEKIFIRSRTMLESVESAVLTVQGVQSCKSYQNDTNEPLLYEDNSMHRPPHSIEVVVAGNIGEQNKQAVAQAILGAKAAGIQTCHYHGIETPAPDDEYAVEEMVIGEAGENIPILFSIPRPLEVNVIVTVAMSDETTSAYIISIIQTIVQNQMERLNPGQDVRPQSWLTALYDNVSGAADFEILLTSADISTLDDTSLSEQLQNNAISVVRYLTNIEYNYYAKCGTVRVLQGV